MPPLLELLVLLIVFALLATMVIALVRMSRAGH
jgi:hypothetical protein